MSNELIAEEVEKLRNQWFRRGSAGARILSQAVRRLRADSVLLECLDYRGMDELAGNEKEGV